MDEQVTLHALDRLEAERKLRSIPAVLLETTWVLDAQVEAVIDALLAAATAGDERAYAHARHVGEWCARIAANLPCAPGAAFMRRCGVLADLDPAVLERVRDVRDCAAVVRAFQRLRIVEEREPEVLTAALIVAAADEFDALIFEADEERRLSPSAALRTICAAANEQTRPIVRALVQTLRNVPADILAAIA